jgi:DNA helicase II / ATP-dependent DNA helicase PcrA
VLGVGVEVVEGPLRWPAGLPGRVPVDPLESDLVVGCEDGLPPLRGPGGPPSAEELAEERRLMFVGITRAQRHLYFSHAAERAGRKTSRSPFLADLREGFEQIGERAPWTRQQHTQLRRL